MKFSNIALIGIITLSTATAALAEGGYGRSLETIKDFRAKQELIHGKKSAEVKTNNAASQAEVKKNRTGSNEQNVADKTRQTTRF